MEFRQLTSEPGKVPRSCRTGVDHCRSLDPFHHQIAPVVAHLEDFGCRITMGANELDRLCLGQHRSHENTSGLSWLRNGLVELTE